jgi:hypothetical protein
MASPSIFDSELLVTERFPLLPSISMYLIEPVARESPAAETLLPKSAMADHHRSMGELGSTVISSDHRDRSATITHQSEEPQVHDLILVTVHK